MFQPQNQITISRTANGFIVCVPLNHGAPIIAGMDEEQVRAQARIMLDELHTGGDEVMKKVREQNAPEKQEHQVIKDKSSFVFKKYSEVISFLNELGDKIDL